MYKKHQKTYLMFLKYNNFFISCEPLRISYLFCERFSLQRLRVEVLLELQLHAFAKRDKLYIVANCI